MAILNEEKLNKDGVIIENILHDSSNVLKTSYNYNTKQLKATFARGGVYTYSEVESKIYEELKKSPSVGVYLNSVIKPNHVVAKVGDAPPKIIDVIKAEIQVIKNNIL